MTACVLEQRSERGIGDHHCSQTEWAVAVYGLDHNGDRGKVRGAKGQSPSRYLCESEQGRRSSERACSLRPGTVLRVHKSGGRNRTLCPQSDSPVQPQRKQRPHKETKCKQAGEEQLAEGSQEG